MGDQEDPALDIALILSNLSPFIGSNGPSTEPRQSRDGAYTWQSYILPGKLITPSHSYNHELRVIQYNNERAAQLFAAHVLPDGSGTFEEICGTYLEGRDRIGVPVHWFRRGSTIVRYVGNDGRIVSALTEACGQQFAGSELDATNRRQS